MHKKWLLFLLIFTLLCSFMGCKRSSSSADEDSLRLDITVAQTEQSLAYLPLYVGIEKGLFKKEGLEIHLKTTVSKGDLSKSLQEGSAQIALVSSEIPFFLHQQKSEAQVICIAQGLVKSSHFLVSRITDKPFNWPDLKNKVILGLKDGDINEILLEYKLKKENLQPLMDVHIVHNLDPKITQGVFLAGSGDFVIVSETEATKLEKANAGQIVTALGTQYESLPLATFMTTAEYIKAQPEICQKFVQGYAETLQWVYLATPEEIVTVITKYFPECDEKTLLRAVSRYKSIGCWPQSPLINEESYLKLQNLLVQMNVVNEKIPFLDLIDPIFAQNIISTTI